jgi:hypothetical protein
MGPRKTERGIQATCRCGHLSAGTTRYFRQGAELGRRGVRTSRGVEGNVNSLPSHTLDGVGIVTTLVTSTNNPTPRKHYRIDRPFPGKRTHRLSFVCLMIANIFEQLSRWPLTESRKKGCPIESTSFPHDACSSVNPRREYFRPIAGADVDAVFSLREGGVWSPDGERNRSRKGGSRQNR